MGNKLRFDRKRSHRRARVQTNHERSGASVLNIRGPFACRRSSFGMAGKRHVHASSICAVIACELEERVERIAVVSDSLCIQRRENVRQS